jgi:hypothetical protein
VALPPAQERANETVSAECMEILQRYRSTFHKQRDDVVTADSVRLLQLLGQSRVERQTRPTLRPEIAAWVRANHRDDIACVAERYGVDLRMDCVGVREPVELNRDNLGVADVLECINSDAVTELLLWIAKSQLDRPRALPVRLAKRFLPSGLVGRLSRLRSRLAPRKR